MASINTYSVSFENITVAEARDLFQILRNGNVITELHEIRLWQTDRKGDANVQHLPILIGFATGDGSGGSAGTIESHSGNGALASATAEVVNTTRATGFTTKIVDGWNILIPYLYVAYRDEDRLLPPAGSRLIVALPNPPSPSIALYGTLTFSERK